MGFCLPFCLPLCLFCLPLQFRIRSTNLGGKQQIWSTQAGLYIPELPLDSRKGHSFSVKLSVRWLMGSRGRGSALSPTHSLSQDLLPKSSGDGEANVSYCTLCCSPSSMAWDGFPQQPQAEAHRSPPMRRPLRSCPNSTCGDTFTL